MKTYRSLKWNSLALALLMSNMACAQDSTPLALPNSGFEEGAKGWTMREKVAMSAPNTEAARSGKMGLRVRDDDGTAGSSALSAPIPIVGGQTYKTTFWARTTTGNAAVVQFRYYDAERKTVSGEGGRLPVKSTENGWSELTLVDKAPQNAASLAIWIHSYPGAKATLDFDDFSLQQVGSDAAVAPAKEPAAIETRPAPPVEPTQTTTAPANPARGNNSQGAKTARVKPPYIIIKADDLRNNNGRVPARWRKFADFIKERKIHASIGVIANSLEGDNTAYISWIKEQQATGLFEFWNHGLVHEPWEENGKKVQEFQGTSYEKQKVHFTRTQQLAREKLGAPFATFGAPSNSSDENTVKVLSEDPDTKIWLYGKEATPAGKLILDRVYRVNIENPLFLPSLEKFVDGYNRYPQREYFVIQGHANKWDDARFEQFTKIVDFLIEQKAIFVTPSEYAKIKATTTPTP